MAAAGETIKVSGIDDLDPLRVQLRYIYNAYRTGLLNKKYYGEKLVNCQRYNLYMELAIALGATGSGGVAGLAIWGTITGKFAWLVISGVATVLSVIKPVMQLGKEIEKYTKLYSGHTTIYLELKSIVEDIERSKSVTTKIEDRYETIRTQAKELGGLDDPRQNEGLVRKLQGEVNLEIPQERLWVP
jgi:hypothetical protein